MSRVKKFVNSLASGYVLLGMNVLFTLASVPLALHYLPKEEFGLWALIAQAAGYLLLLDLGMSSSISRILIDHKDDARSTAYGATIQTGFLVLLIQGMLITLGGGIVSFWLPELMNVPGEYSSVFRSLMIWQCVVLGMSFVGRMFVFILQAHQRYDIHNYAQTGGFVVNLLALWAGFEWQMGLYSLLLGGVVNALFLNGYCLCAVWRLGFFPATGRWGRANGAAFRELFLYATNIFLPSVGNMLISASQVIVVSRTLGLEAAAVWSIATKLFNLAQQVVARIHDFSTAALAEMMVRSERERLRARFRDTVVLTASAGVFISLAVALCNPSFLEVWTRGRITWEVQNNLLMAIYILVYNTTRCSIGLIVMIKRVGTLKFIYLFEGAAFVVMSLLLSPHLSFAGVIISGILTNTLFSGLYGLLRVTDYFGISSGEVLLGWLKNSLRLFVFMLATVSVLWFATCHFLGMTQLAVNVITSGVIGGVCFWRFGLPEHLRNEIVTMLNRSRAWRRLTLRKSI